MRRFLRLLAVALLVSVCAPLHGDDPLGRVVVPGETAGSARRLAAADKLVADEQWTEAVEEYQRMLEEAGDELVVLSPRSSLQARRLCQLRIAALPAAALKLYRERVDTQAEKWLKQWEAERDPRVLRRIADDAFCSRPAERALDLLGDLAFERGDFDEAEQWWRSIVLPASVIKEASKDKEASVTKEASKQRLLVFPDPQLDPARIRAKQVLARLYRGDKQAADAEAKTYREVHGKAEGTLAGRKGLYADILQELSELPPGPEGSARSADGDWPTFAGSLSRQRILEQAPLRAILEEPTWTWPLGREENRVVDKDRKVPTMRELARALVFNPVVVGDQVLLADARFVTAFDLRTGKRAVWYDLVRDGKKDGFDANLRLPAEQDLGYTLTVADDMVFARMGAQRLEAAAPEKPGAKKLRRDSFLVCLNQKLVGGLRQRWIKPAASDDKSTAMFEGAPVVQAGRVYIAVTRFDAASVTAVASFNAATGSERWRKPVELCEVQEQRGPRYRHHLLTLAGSKIVYCSHSGAVVALDGDTGRVVWAARYPSRGERTSEGKPTPRDLAPCLYAAGRLFVAPADHDRILCLDPETGRLIWESAPPGDVVNLLGAVHDKLIVTTTNDIRAIDLPTGQTLRDWLQPEDGSSLPPFGRGLLAGAWVYWPTVQGLRVLEQETGQPVARVPYNFTFNRLRGNLAASHGCLVVADNDSLRAYVAPAKFLEERRKDVGARPESNSARYALALAEADAGLHDEALANFAKVGGELKESARARRYDLLLECAELLASGGRMPWAPPPDGSERADALPPSGGLRPPLAVDQAVAYLKQASAAEFPVFERLRALAREAQLWAAAKQPARAVAVWQSILQDDQLRGGRLDDGALPQLGGVIAEMTIDDLIKAHGASVYEPTEEAAKKLLRAAKDERRLETLERLVHEFPNAAVTAAALPELAKLQEQAGRSGAAVRTYRVMLRRHTTADRDRAAAGAALDRQVQKSAETRPDLPLPLLRNWHITSANNRTAAMRLLVPANGVPARDCVFFSHHDAKGKVFLSCHDADSGTERWRRSVPNSLHWLARYADLVVAASADSISCFSVADGVALWTWHRSHHAPRDGSVTRSVTPRLSLGHFRLEGDRLFFLEGQRRLLALEVGSGQVLWSQWAPAAKLGLAAPAGRFHGYHAGKKWLAAQTSGGRLWGLDSLTGRKLHQLDTSDQPWPRPAVPLDERRLLVVADPQQLALVDAAYGQEIWKRSTPKPSVSGEVPKIAGNSAHLLAMIDGWQLESLDLETGTPRWRVGNPLWIDPALADWHPAIDDSSFCFVARNILHACALADGRPLWNVNLPFHAAATWQITRTRSHLVVYPLNVPSRAPVLLSTYLVNLPRGSRPQELPIFFFDPKDGQLVQRLNFPFDGSPPAVQFLEKGLAVSSAGQAWGIGAK